MRVGEVLRAQAVDRNGGIALTEIFVEPLNEGATIVRVRTIDADDHSW
jgi:hypothetical protein